MKDGVNRCRKCGKPVAVICWGLYRKTLVDEEAVMVKADPEGEEYIRIDGSKVRAKIVPFEESGDAEPAYRPHSKTCGAK